MSAEKNGSVCHIDGIVTVILNLGSSKCGSIIFTNCYNSTDYLIFWIHHDIGNIILFGHTSSSSGITALGGPWPLLSEKLLNRTYFVWGGLSAP
jgi:hypothetical protein